MSRAVMTTQELPRRGHEARPSAPRRAKVVVKRIDPWSVLKVSLLFYFCVMLIVLFGLLVLYWVLDAMGFLDATARVLTQLFGLGGKGGFHFHAVPLFTRLFLIGVVGVVIWSFVNLLLALLYNLISDVVGGIQVTLGEKP